MCFFVCLALPQQQSASELKTLANNFDLTDATDWPIGKAARGNRDLDRAFLITYGGCSCFISEGKKHRAEKTKLAELEILIQSLSERLPSFSILIHYAAGDMSTESVVQKDKRLVSFAEERSRLSQLELDVRYVIRASPVHP